LLAVVATEVVATEVSTGVEFTPDAASVVMFIVVAIVTSMEAAAMATGTMATGTTDVMAIIIAAVIPEPQLASVFLEAS
jgi:hypothetical protein